MRHEAIDAHQEDVAFQARLYSDPNPTRRGLHIARRDWVLDKAMRYSEAGETVIEVGVGCGVFTRALSDAGRSVTAVDINTAFLANVEALANVAVHRRDATRALDLGQHDLAICSEVLEHVAPAASEAMLRSLHGSLKPGRVLILTTPQRFSTVELMARLLRFRPILALARRLYGSADELGHINLLTAARLGRQFRAAGFEIVEQRRFGFYLPAVAEFGGKAGARLLGGMAGLLRPVPILRGLLWTQGWVLRRPA
jgi:2-polyprenyl-3-methyl-5-hydroxy-6-metoxy-1,4-benzoquinol methylase